MFKEGLERAIQLEAACDDCTDLVPGSALDPVKANFATQTNSSGLGVRFNADQCTVCHNQPALGGSGGFVVPNPQDPPSLYRPSENPMFDLIPHRKGATNTVPSFITRFGPIREVRFAKKPDGSADGGVHQLFTVAGRSDVFPAWQSGTCSAAALPQPDFENEYRRDNVRFRIPLQLFGLGIIDGIQDREILARHQATAAIRAQLGIVGVPNRSGNDGTIARSSRARPTTLKWASPMICSPRPLMSPRYVPQTRVNPTILPASTRTMRATRAFTIRCMKCRIGSCSPCSCAFSMLRNLYPCQPARGTAKTYSAPALAIPASAAPPATRPRWSLRQRAKLRRCRTSRYILSRTC
jgi:hypothetical protein